MEKLSTHQTLHRARGTKEVRGLGKYQIIKPARVPGPALLLHSTQLLQKEAPWYFHESMAFKDTDAKEGKGRMTFLTFSFHKSPPCVLNGI